MIRSEMIRSPVSPWIWGSSSPPSAVTIKVGRWGCRGPCAPAGGAKAAAPAVRRKARRPSSIVIAAHLLAADRPVIAALEAAAALHDEKDRAQVRNVRDRIAGEHDHIGEM